MKLKSAIELCLFKMLISLAMRTISEICFSWFLDIYLRDFEEDISLGDTCDDDVMSGEHEGDKGSVETFPLSPFY